MAKIKGSVPAETTTGILGKVDKSVGRKGGLGVLIASGKYGGTLGIKTDRTKTRSPGQVTRSAIYCNCDEGWKGISAAKRQYLGVYHSKIRLKPLMHMTNYLCWMSLCMTAAIDNNLFLLNSYVSRYVIKNDSGAPWTGHKVTLTNIPIKSGPGTDVAVKHTTYHRQVITTLQHKVSTPGSINVCLPDMAAGETVYIDIYSYGTYSTPQNCPSASIPAIDALILANTNISGWFVNKLTHNITWTAPISGLLYWFFTNRYSSMAALPLNLNSSIGPQTLIGRLPGNFYGYYIYAYRMGPVKAGTEYIITGNSTDPDAGPRCCDCPCMLSVDNPTYTGIETWHRPTMLTGANECCGGDYNPVDGILIEYETYTEIPPSQQTQIGPL